MSGKKVRPQTRRTGGKGSRTAGKVPGARPVPGAPPVTVPTVRRRRRRSL